MSERRFAFVRAGWCAGALAAALMVLLGGCGRDEPGTPAAPAAPAAGELAAIAAEQNTVLRVHLLSVWVGGLDEAALLKSVKNAPEELQGELMWLASLRMKQLHPKETEEELGRRLTGALHDGGREVGSGDEKRGQTTQDKLLELAKTDPEKALEQAMHSKLHPNDADQLKVQILRQLGETDPERAFALMQTRRDVKRAEVGAEIAAAWGKRDPEAALRWLAKQPANYATRQLTMSVLEGWAETDVSAAMEKIASLPAGPDNEYALRQIAVKWMKDDPALAAEWVKKQPRLDPVLVKAALSALATTHPDLAAGILMTQVEPGRRQLEVDRIVQGWMAKDPGACVAWLRTLPVGEIQLRGLSEAGEELARTKPAEAMALLKEWPAGANSERLVKAIAGSLTDGPAAMAWLSTLPDSKAKTDSLAATIDRMTQGDTGKLLGMVAGMESGPLKTELLGRVAYAKFDEDTAAAIAWAKTVTDREQVTAIVQRVGYRWAEADPRGAAEYVKTMAPGGAKDRMVSSVVDKWSEKEPLAAANWAMGLEDSQASRSAVGRTFAELAKSQPETAMRMMAAMPAGEAREYALSYSVSRLAESSPKAGVELVTQLAPEKRQADFAERLSSGWSAHDLPAALTWVSGLASGEVRDGAIGGVVKAAAEANPTQALALTAGITKDERRVSAVQAVLGVWYVQNPTAALAALSGVNLPEAKREEIGRKLRGEK